WRALSAGGARGVGGAGSVGGALRAVSPSCAGGACGARSAFVGQQTPGVGTGIGRIIRVRVLLADVAGAVVLHAVVHGIGGCAAPVGFPHQTSGAGRAHLSRPPVRTLVTLTARRPPTSCTAFTSRGS